MKYVKILGLLAVAAAAMMAFAASASATYVTTTTGGAEEEPTIHATNEGGHVSLANSIATISCSSTTEGAVENNKESVEHQKEGKTLEHTNVASGLISHLTFTSCTNGWTVDVNAGGSLAVTHTSGHDGTLRSSGATVTAIRHTIFGTVECRYSTSNTFIGTVTGGNPATLKIEGSIPFHSGGGLCGSGNSAWTGNYVTTSALYVAS